MLEVLSIIALLCQTPSSAGIVDAKQHQKACHRELVKCMGGNGSSYNLIKCVEEGKY